MPATGQPKEAQRAMDGRISHCHFGLIAPLPRCLLRQRGRCCAPLHADGRAWEASAPRSRPTRLGRCLGHCFIALLGLKEEPPRGVAWLCCRSTHCGNCLERWTCKDCPFCLSPVRLQYVVGGAAITALTSRGSKLRKCYGRPGLSSHFCKSAYLAFFQAKVHCCPHRPCHRRPGSHE